MAATSPHGLDVSAGLDGWAGLVGSRDRLAVLVWALTELAENAGKPAAGLDQFEFSTTRQPRQCV
jgi:hypothetical protein